MASPGFDEFLARFSAPQPDSTPSAPEPEIPVEVKTSPGFDAFMAKFSSRPPAPRALSASWAEAMQGREAALSSFESGIGKAIAPTGPGGQPQMGFQGDVQEAYFNARRRGVPGLPPPEQLVAKKILPSAEQPGLLGRAESFLKDIVLKSPGTWYGKVGQQALYGVAGSVLGPAGAMIVPEAIQQARALYGPLAAKQMANPPGGETVRSPTVLSIAMDVLGTTGRLRDVAVRQAGIGPEGEQPSIGMDLAGAFVPPSWSQGSPRPADFQKMFSSWVKENGGDPDRWYWIGAGIVADIVTDLISWVGPGEVKATAMVAADQATNVARAALRRNGLTGKALDAMTSVVRDDVLAAQKQGGFLEQWRPLVREVVEQAAPGAGVDFDMLGKRYGTPGPSVHAPIPLVNLTIEAPMGLRQAAGKVIDPVSGAVVGMAKRAEDALPWLRKLHQAFSPIAEQNFDKGWDGATEYYLRNAALKNPVEHEARVVAAQFGAMTRASKAARTPEEAAAWTTASVEQLAKMVTETPVRTVEAGRNAAAAIIEAPHTAALHRFRDGTFAVPEAITKQTKPLELAARRAYTHGIVEAATLGYDPVVAQDALAGHLTATLKATGFADDAADTIATSIASKALPALTADLPHIRTATTALPDRVAAIVDFYKASTAAMLSKEQGILAGFAKQAATEAARLAQRAGKVGADVSDAAAAAHNHVMGKATRELDAYYYHFIQNVDAVRRRGPLGGMVSMATKPQRERMMLAVVENFEAGQNPATDAIVSLAGRQYANMRFMAKHEAANLAFSDRRWAVPIAESKGLTTAAGWDEMTHPVTGQRYAVRREVYDALNRAIAFHDPEKGLDALARGFYDPFMSRWKGMATHGRVVFYNLRNAVDDGFRMWMGGYDFNPRTLAEAGQIALLGHLESGAAVAPYVRRARGPGETAFEKWYRTNADALTNGFHNTLRKWASKSFTNASGETATAQEIYDAAARTGVIEKGYATAELAPYLPSHIESARQFDRTNGTWRAVKPFSQENALIGPQGFYLRTTGSIAKQAEQLRRMTLFHDRWKAGETFDQAAMSVKKWMFNYSDLTQFEQSVIRRFVPFYAFLRNSLPAHASAMLTHPGRYLAIGKAKHGVEAQADREFGPVGVVDQYLDDTYAWRIPTASERGSPVFWNPGLSMSDVNVAQGGASDTWDRITPVMDVATILRGHDPRTGAELSGRTREPDIFLGAMAKAYNASVPERWRDYRVGQLRKDEKGNDYFVLPAKAVALYNKLFPNFIAYGRAFAHEKGDIFERDAMKWRRRRELTGQSFQVLAPEQAETNYLRNAVQSGGLAGPAHTPLGVGVRTP